MAGTFAIGKSVTSEQFTAIIIKHPEVNFLERLSELLYLGYIGNEHVLTYNVNAGSFFTDDPKYLPAE